MEEQQENQGISVAGFNEPQINVVNQMTPSQQQIVNVVSKTKRNDLEDVNTPSNRRSLSTSSWAQVASFSELENSFEGGNRVSMSGDGKYLASAPSRINYSGIVRFFQKQESNGTWAEMIDLRLTNDFLGLDVSLSGNGKRVAIGAYGDDGAANEAENSGSVSVYERNGDGPAWSLMGEVIHGESKGDQSGFSVALSKDGNTLAIGAPYNDGNGQTSGHVRVYRWDDDIDGGAAREYSGLAVALSEDGSVVAIGSPYANFNSGQVRVFYWDIDEGNASNSKWIQRGVAIVGDDRDEHGRSVDLSEDGKILAVGSYEGKYVKVFQWKDDNEDDDEWEQIGQTLGGGNRFGWSVSLSIPPSAGSTILAVGSKTTAFTYTLVGDGWEALPTGDLAGAEVSLSSDGRTIAIGDPLVSGNVTVFSLPVQSTSGSNGDPHFRTWSGGHFEYHGQCDMILVKDEEFADGLGLEVQIRTKLVRFWSFIQNAAIRIGEDTLEMQGSPELSMQKGNNHYWINSIYQGQVTSLGGLPVTANYAGKHKNKRWFFSKYGGGNKISRSFEIDLSSKYPGQKIVIGSYKEFVRIDFHNANLNAFGNSVLPEDGMLFHNISQPQFPEKCIDPEARAMKRRRRLGESSITNEQAEAACASIEDGLDRKDCVYDVLVTQDPTMVGAYYSSNEVYYSA
eukprot:scaffold77_cov78-Cylindrotheca_fusiformis.AAC.1